MSFSLVKKKSTVKHDIVHSLIILFDFTTPAAADVTCTVSTAEVGGRGKEEEEEESAIQV